MMSEIFWNLPETIPMADVTGFKLGIADKNAFSSFARPIREMGSRNLETTSVKLAHPNVKVEEEEEVISDLMKMRSEELEEEEMVSLSLLKPISLPNETKIRLEDMCRNYRMKELRMIAKLLDVPITTRDVRKKLINKITFRLCHLKLISAQRRDQILFMT